MPITTQFKKVEAGQTKFVKIVPGIPMTEDSEPMGLALMVLSEEGDTGPILVHPLDSAEEVVAYMAGLVTAGALAFSKEAMDAAMKTIFGADSESSPKDLSN